jgi:hypothetical protein
MTHAATRDPGWFDDLPVIGELSPADAARKLRELGDERTASILDAATEPGVTRRDTFAGTRGIWPFRDRAWQHTAHVFGYLPPRSGAGPVTLVPAAEIDADTSLRGAKVKVTLDAMRVADYPGSGTHRILFDFYAQNHLRRTVEHLHYTLTLRVREGQAAAVVGYPIFLDLTVGGEGLCFKCFTVNVKNDADEAVLRALESDVLRNGLRLAATVQPAIATVSGFALGLTKAIASRNRNVPVQDFYLGLDFSDIASRGRLATGSYMAVQVPDEALSAWDWNEWQYRPASGHLVSAVVPERLLPYNYVVFSVSCS